MAESRRPVRPAAVARLVVCLAVVLAAGGCGPAFQRAPAPPAPLTYEAALARIPLDGTPGQPLFWRVDQPSDPRAREAVRAVRHFLALGTVPAPVPSDYLELLAAVAASWRVERQRPYLGELAGPDHDPLRGPRWVWVMDAWVDGPTAGVLACVDDAYYERVSDGGGREPAHELRWSLLRYGLVREPDPDGIARWKVDAVDFSGLLTVADQPDLDLRRRQCDRWARHPLESAGRPAPAWLDRPAGPAGRPGTG